MSPRQPSVTLSNAGTRKKFPAGIGLPGEGLRRRNKAWGGAIRY